MVNYKRNMKSEQRGTLLIEALAMLGLIAMVTPTLYKKSADRLFEIQDINVASQMRTMNNIVETFVRNNSNYINEEFHSGKKILRICYEKDTCDDPAGVDKFHTGYSSMVPFGFNFENVKNFKEPRVYVYKDTDTSSGTGNLLYYIVYDKDENINIGAKRVSRLASLVGANGGVIGTDSNGLVVNGVGGGWKLENEALSSDLGIDKSLSENSIMITADEPIIVQEAEEEHYLVRVPEGESEGGDYFKNAMITDLFMGYSNISKTEGYTDVEDKEHYSIFNVRKLTLNTDCDGTNIRANPDSKKCNPNVADLYVGKPTGSFTSSSTGGRNEIQRNTGAAWFYGNLSALNDNFRLFRIDNGKKVFRKTGDIDRAKYGSNANGHYDVMEFSRFDEGHGPNAVATSDDDSSLSIFRADNKPNDARVRMMNGFVEVAENYQPFSSTSGYKAFLVGANSTGAETNKGEIIAAWRDNDQPGGAQLHLNNDAGETFINAQGGNVYINNNDSTDVSGDTYINHGGLGAVQMGAGGDWFTATGVGDSAYVSILGGNSSGVFSVGTEAGSSIVTGGKYGVNMIWADGSRTSLRGDRLRVYDDDRVLNGGSTDIGGMALLSAFDGTNSDTSTGVTFVTTPFTDILSTSLYVGPNAMKNGTGENAVENYGAKYSRKGWQMGVAGSAWVDDMLWARRAWLGSGGMAELHAGHSSYNDFSSAPEKAWLNVYPGKDADDGVVIRNAANIDTTADRFDKDLLFRAYSAGVEIRDSTQVAFADFEDGSSWVGARGEKLGEKVYDNVFMADSYLVKMQGVTKANIYTVDASSGVVDVQGGAIEAVGAPGGSSEEIPNDGMKNHILARGDWFGIRTNDTDNNFSSTDVGNDGKYTHFRVGASEDAKKGHDAEVRVKYADFAVRTSSVVDSTNTYVNLARFYVRPDLDPDTATEANVKMDGSLHVTGNNVIHVATHSSYASGQGNEKHAMFEVDPNYLQVMEMDGDTVAIGKEDHLDMGKARAMFRINPRDIGGESIAAKYDSTTANPTTNASVYVRKGAIELMQSDSSSIGKHGADEGYGYIRANRFVSNTGETVPGVPGIEGVQQYDQYMVNPAYTSVMHDIKLTTRGGARLSDILPDYILKGVYNVSNDFLEGSKTNRVSWSCGSQCENGLYVAQTGKKVYWADPYVGVLPYALCPPTYRQFATLVPISFMMGVTGDIKKPSELFEGHTSGKYTVDFKSPRQAGVLGIDNVGYNIKYPGFDEVKVAKVNVVNGTGSSFADKLDSSIAGWFRGIKAVETGVNGELKGEMSPSSTTVDGVTAWVYQEGESKSIMAEPLYFQQNTWLKTSVVPNHTNAGMTGWAGYMGFIYDSGVWGLGSGAGNTGLFSNNADKYNDSSSTDFYGFEGNNDDLVWNLFPTPTNSIEGHGTVYCYFDRSVYTGAWSSLVDPVDQMNSYREKGKKLDGDGGNQGYIDRLDDPTLKYDDPW